MDNESELERRVITQSPELHINRDDNGRTVIRGVAALYNSDSKNLGGFIERIAPGAFDAVLATNPDVLARYNHSDDFLLGRTTSGTLRLYSDEVGLRYEIDPPQSRMDVIESLQRGDVTQSSFAFRIGKNTNEVWTRREDGMQVRTINAIDFLADIAPVIQPAYEGTQSYVSKRAMSMVVNVNVEVEHEEASETPMEDVAPDEEVEKYSSTKPTAGMASSAKRGLAFHEAGRSSPDMSPEIVANAHRIAKREVLTSEHVARMNDWFRATSINDRSGWDAIGEESHAYVEHLLWGGDDAANWSARKTSAMISDQARSISASLRSAVLRCAMHDNRAVDRLQ